MSVYIVKRSEDQIGFQVLTWRWVVERTFGWFMEQRRLVRNHETKTSHAEAMLYFAIATIMLRRLARKADESVLIHALTSRKFLRRVCAGGW